MGRENGIPIPSNQIRLSVKLEELDSFECTCGESSFSLALKLKFIPPLLSPTGAVQPIFVQDWIICNKCSATYSIKDILKEYSDNVSRIAKGNEG